MSEAQLFSTMTLSESRRPVLVTPLFRPFATELISRLKHAMADRLERDPKHIFLQERHLLSVTAFASPVI